MRKILGLDISSTTCGVAILYCDDNISPTQITQIDSIYIKPQKNGSIFERIKKIQDDISKILEKYKPDEIAIEDITQFMGGSSSANTIILLAIFNRSIGLVCYNFLGRPPELYNVLKIRHKIKISKELPKKEDIFELIKKKTGITLEPEPFNPPIKTIKCKKIKNKQPTEFSDCADAAAVALCHMMILDEK
jgi:Holliday junction resolvasome RuvABC endonuclease subunit